MLMSSFPRLSVEGMMPEKASLIMQRETPPIQNEDGEKENIYSRAAGPVRVDFID